jgi:hypothetical protein
LGEGKSVAVGGYYKFSKPLRPPEPVFILNATIDNTNPDNDVRSKWIALAAKHSVPIRCVLFNADAAVCEHNDVVRALNDGVCQIYSLLQFLNKYINNM